MRFTPGLQSDLETRLKSPLFLHSLGLCKVKLVLQRMFMGFKCLTQAINGLPGVIVTPGQTLMLPCGRILAYYTGFNAAAAASKEAPASTSSG